jgi:hypothetical protein
MGVTKTSPVGKSQQKAHWAQCKRHWPFLLALLLQGLLQQAIDMDMVQANELGNPQAAVWCVIING